MTQQELETQLTTYSESLGLDGIINSSIIKLLAYALYVDNANLNNKILNSLFSSSTTLNARLTHAAQLLYHVDRGSNAQVLYENIIAGKSGTYSYLESAFQYNGYYYYYAQDYTVTAGTTYDIKYVAADKSILEHTVDVSDNEYQYVDFPCENVSEDLVLMGTNAAETDTVLSWTSDSYAFFQDELDSEGEYVYQYLIMTIADYGVRLIKRYEEDTWEYTSYTIRYIPYSEFIPSLTELRNLGDFEYVEEEDVTLTGDYTELTVTKYSSRMENMETIYINATKYFMSRNQIGSITDIEYIIESYSTDDLIIHNIVNELDETGTTVIGYSIYVDASDAIRDSITSDLTSKNLPFAFTVYPMEAKEIDLTYTSSGDYYTETELNDYFYATWKEDRDLTLPEVQAQILRYDTNMTYCNLAYTDGSTEDQFTLESNQYYSITLHKDTD